jgi:hypothetical protein
MNSFFYSQQNNGKSNSATHQKEYSPRPGRLHPRDAGVVQHTKINKRNKTTLTEAKTKTT